MLVDAPLGAGLPSPTLEALDGGAVEQIYSSVMAAALGGDVAAQQQMGVLHHRGVAGRGPDFEEAARWFAKAAEAGLASAQCNLGLLHLLGHGVPADDRLARNPRVSVPFFRRGRARSRP